eukprot:4791438-Pleurochrysis_carterae.AAC.1
MIKLARMFDTSWHMGSTRSSCDKLQSGARPALGRCCVARFHRQLYVHSECLAQSSPTALLRSPQVRGAFISSLAAAARRVCQRRRRARDDTAALG